MNGRLPNLLIIGSMKSGTTSLHNYLSLHPDIYMSNPKEIHYYADKFYLSETLDWYKSFFVSDKKIVGTTPQSYTKCHNKYYKNIPERIFKTNPNIKMIYIVRDPIERYKSHILESYYSDPLKDILYSFKIDNFIKTSMYFLQISEYLKYFDLKQIHILSLEDLQNNRLNELNKIFSFLSVKEISDSSVFNFKSNTAEQKEIPFFIKKTIFFRFGKKLCPNLTFILATFFTKLFFNRLLTKPNLSEKKITELKKILKPDIDRFRELTGKSFSEWQI